MASKLSDHRGIADGSRWNRNGLLRQCDLDCVGGHLPARGLLVFFAALEATSLANVWAQVVSGLRVLSDSHYARPSRNVMPIPSEGRG